MKLLVAAVTLSVFITTGLDVNRSLAQSVNPQEFDSLTQAYPDSVCSACNGWSVPQEPFLIHQNSYYVGTRGVGAILITSDDGHILIDGGLPNTAPMIIDNIQALGFRVGDIELILNSHAHYDHAGGLAALQLASGARVAATPESASVIENGMSGPDDPQFGVLFNFPAVTNVQRFTAGDTLNVGGLQVASHATAGHTPGGTTWSWESCEGDSCLNLVYADSQTPVSADGFLYTNNASYPTALDDFEQGFQTLELMRCDILITTHPSASSVWRRFANGGRQGLIDPDACRMYANAARQQVVARINSETSSSNSGE